MGQFKVVERNNPLAVHCIADTRERAQRWIDVLAPEYCARGLFDDKTLTPGDFEVLPRHLMEV